MPSETAASGPNDAGMACRRPVFIRYRPSAYLNVRQINAQVVSFSDCPVAREKGSVLACADCLAAASERAARLHADSVAKQNERPKPDERPSQAKPAPSSGEPERAVAPRSYSEPERAVAHQ